MQVDEVNKTKSRLSKKVKKIHQNASCFSAFAGGLWTVPVFCLIHFAADKYDFPQSWTFYVVFSVFMAAFLTTYPLMFLVFYLYEKLNSDKDA